MTQRDDRLPKRLWVLWFQGLDNAPLVVRRCVASWIAANPDWEVVVLDEDNLGDYVTLDLPDRVLASIAPAHRAALVRLYLLSNYGGVWTDATTFCIRPLSEWIFDCVGSGFFAFFKPGRDRLLSSWFLASVKGCPVTVKLYDRLKRFLSENEFDVKGKRKKRIIRVLDRLLNRSTTTTRFWFSPVVTRLLKVHPYFLIAYLFERLIAEDRECKRIWDETPKISADGPHRLQEHGLLAPADGEIRREIAEAGVPLYKLTWRFDATRYAPGTLLHYLLEERSAIGVSELP